MSTAEVAEPELGPGQVLVKTLACGICGSDLHAVTHFDQMVAMQERTSPSGKAAMDRTRNLVMGHEFCAEIIEHGPDTASTLPVGTRVCSMPVLLKPDGIGTVGYSHEHPGGYGEFMALSEAMLLPVPDDLSTAMAALTEPMAVGRHAVEMAHLEDEVLPLVIGCGPVGLAVIAALRQKGIGPIMAADFSPARRELAGRLGADVVLDPADVSPYEAWTDMAWPPEADRNNPLIRFTGPHPRPGVIFECVGVPGVINQIFEGAMRGTRIIVVGVCMQHDSIEPLMGISKELNVQFVLGYTPEEFTDSLRGLAAGELDSAGEMITGTVDIAGVPQAFVDLADPEAHAKIMVEPGYSAPAPATSGSQ